MIKRILENKLLSLRQKFPVITLTGPRQSGKTTLLRAVFDDLPYVNLEDIDIRNIAINDPRGFLSNYPNGAIFDEVQRTPELFSYIQGVTDSGKSNFILSGSQNFLMMENISQTLAGRTSVLKLMPFSLSELKDSVDFQNPEDCIFRGFYPRLYDKNIYPPDFYPSYISTYIERDVRILKNIENLNTFSHFIGLCAGRTGQLLNINSLATDASISPNTAKAWLSLLEASYIIWFLQPHHKNFNKRIVKSPKLYFCDTGIACSLLNIENSDQLKTHYLKGALFENFILNEFVKSRLNKGLNLNLFFWQNKEKREIDLIIDSAGNLIPYEIKSGMTIQQSFLDNLRFWQKLTQADTDILNVIYGGDSDLKTSNGNFVSWRNINL
jgi:hypothetical protein